MDPQKGPQGPKSKTQTSVSVYHDEEINLVICLELRECIYVAEREGIQHKTEQPQNLWQMTNMTIVHSKNNILEGE